MSPISIAVAPPVSGPLGADAEKRRTRLEMLVLLLLILPVMLKSGYGVTVLTEVMVFAIAAMSLDLLLGYTGLASFGHAMFFGMGAYAAGLLGVHYPALLPFTLAAAALVGAVAACGTAYLVLRSAGIYFIFLTLALSQMIFAVAFKWKWLTGGDDGLPGVPRPSFGPLDRYFSADDNTVFYVLTLVVFVLSYLALKRITNSPFGSVLIGIRENRSRMEALGYDTRAYMIAAFAIAGLFAGVAGGLFAHQFRLVSPEQLHWQASAILLVMVVLGGSGSLIGPVIGSLLIILLQNVVSSYTQRWPSIMAVSFIIVVLYARGGIWGFISKLGQSRGEK
ncbi:branched-chain amino acid ABC transporter permease [Lacisediminimonas profundi]|uniref:branched-chain amino acid ABC transporter permease n=1 Tax=Lacisediminimonas profundi TaxID=2603856 RepID=UPI0013869658|nr:branched-chain amino acid ABC transporter permease [Lacisediminimonas profundi]